MKQEVVTLILWLVAVYAAICVVAYFGNRLYKFVVVVTWEGLMVEGPFGGAVAIAAAVFALVSPVQAAPCGNGPAGFENWKQVFAQEASGRGITLKAISALMTTTYSTGTIRADRGQKSFSLSLDAFMAKRGAAGIIARGRSLRAANASL